MIGRSIILVVSPVLFAVASLVTAADESAPNKPEPPVLLKKKAKSGAGEVDKPTPEPKKTDPPDAREEKPRLEKPADSIEQEQDKQETLNRISRNMRLAKDRLANKELTESTLQVQRDILKDLDALIEQQSRPPQDGSRDDSSGGASGSGKQQRQSASRRPQTSSRSQAGSRSVPVGKTPPGMAGNLSDRGGGGVTPARAEQVHKLADLFKDEWGKLPEKMRAEMDAYARDAFMDKYKELIERYYATIAEKSRRQGD